MNQRHLLECQFLSGKSEIIRSIPDYNDLFKEEIEQQIYISRLLKENHKRMLAQTTKWTGNSPPCSAMTAVIVMDIQKKYDQSIQSYQCNILIYSQQSVQNIKKISELSVYSVIASSIYNFFSLSIQSIQCNQSI